MLPPESPFSLLLPPIRPPHSFLFPAKLAGNGGNSRPVFEIDSHSRLFYSRLFQHEKGYIPAIRRHSWPHFEILSHSRPFCSRPLHKGSGKYAPPLPPPPKQWAPWYSVHAGMFVSQTILSIGKTNGII